MRFAFACACLLMMQPQLSREIILTSPPPSGPYSTAVKAGGFVFAAGTLAQDERGRIVGEGDVAAQTRHTLERIGRVLAAAGSSLEQAVAVTVYLTSASDFQAMNEAYRAFWAKDPPTRTTVITSLVAPGALVEITVTAAVAGGERTIVHPKSWPASPNPYSYAIRSGDTLFMSGLVPRRGRDNTVVGGDIREQTRAVMDNAAELLDAAGLSFAHVVSARVYLTDTSDFAGMNEVSRTRFPSAPPARATVKSGLAGPGFRVEMTFTASAAARDAIGTPPAGVPISPAVRAGRWLYLSGALGNTPATAGDVRAQTRETLARLKATLGLAGFSERDVVDSLVYLKDVSAFAPMNEIYAAFFGGGFPARTTVGTPLVADDGLVEIMFTAIAP